MTKSVRLHTCNLCEAICGLAVETDGGRVVTVRGDRDDPFSRGHICPKAAALDDIRLDPNRVLTPLRRTTAGFEPARWSDALDLAAARIARIQDEHGRDSVAIYLGNPLAHNYSGLLFALFLWTTLGTRARFSATSADQLPHMLAGLEMFGHQALLPVPDIDRTDFFLILGANPVVSNGSLMTAPGVADRMKQIRARGGRVVVVDPRRTETAAIADAHHFIRPGSDAFLLLALLHTIFDERLARPGRLASLVDGNGLDALERVARPFSPAAVAALTGIDALSIQALARDFAGARSAVCYGRLGLCTQDFGGTAAWLVQALNIVTGNFDREGGAMFTSPAVDLVKLASLIGQRGSFGAYKSRVRGLPEFGGELPIATLAEEIETPGPGQIRALVTIAGNPALSAPNGARLERALAKLDFMVSIDLYKNETTRHANLILPTSFGLEKDHFDVVLNTVAVRNTARYAKALFAPAGETRHDWDILLDLAARIGARGGSGRRVATRLAAKVLRLLGPQRLLDGLLRAGPRRLSLRELESKPHGIDLGALVPRLPELLHTPGRRIRLAPALYVADVARLKVRLDAHATASNGHLELIGRRQLRSNNSWMHNSLRLVKGRERCTLLIHPDDARARGLETGQQVTVRSAAGEVSAPIEITTDIARGVVSLPHGWGHDREGAALDVARAHAGASINDLTDDARVDALSATASFSGVPVVVLARP